ncbi:type I secretion target GGXGXDXXX repeat protein domain protein [Leptolyngbya sp. NIES-3755]|nr:type I secretion target GGXGXDXXX repeat protein domain protein [Leptolyngbya sp. NIES-3755]
MSVTAFLNDKSAALLNLDGTLETFPSREAIGEQTRLAAFQLGSSAATVNLLARKASDGSTQIWSVNGSNSAARRNLPTESDAGWQVAGIADFDRDGQQDLLWRDVKTGAVRIWQLNNDTAQTISLPTVNDLGWQISGLADFNNDGSTDILWQNRRSGEVVLWFLNRTSVTSGSIVGSTGASNWRIQGITDFNNDGNPDLVWYNTSSAETVYWLFSNGRPFHGALLNQAPSTDWKVAGIGDFNGDNSSDLFWRNDRTGETQFWLYSGTQRTQVRSGTPIASSWQSVGATDLNGDRTTDLLWRNPSTGELLAWFVQNGSLSSSATVLTERDLDWQPIAALERSTSPLITPTQTTVQTGNLTSNGTIATAEIQAPIFTRTDRVDAGNNSDFYRFTIGQSGVFTAGLTGLTGDADVRLIQDTNGNGTVDNGEILAWQWERGTANESIRRFLAAGTYLVQVVSYNNQTANFTLATNFTVAANDPQQFRIDLSFADSLTGLNSAARDAIAQAARFWEGVILGASAITRSNILSIALDGQSFNAQDGTADTGTLALSGPSLTLDAANNLVITRGRSTLNLRRIAEFNSNPLYLRDIMIHELAHVFGFGTIWQPLEFSFTDGSTLLAGKNWINRTNATYRADSYAGWAYGDLLGTFTPTAIPIEPQIFFHWDESRFDTELMTPFAETPGTPMPMSSLTLGALRDLGWNVNFGAVQPYTLPATRTAAVSSVPGGATQTSGLAAYKCACGRCLSAIRTETLSPNLTDLVA